METRNLGRTEWAVTTLGFGAMELRHLHAPDARRVLNAVLDGGVNYIDTSPDYGPSEDYVGNALAQRRREFYLASKCGCNIDAAGQSQDPRHIYTRPQLLKNIEASLRRLKTDHVDVWQLHGPGPEELVGGRGGEVVETMLELKRQGKVRAIGLSFMNGRRGDALYPAGYGLKYLREFAAWRVFDVMQIVYGGLVRTSENLIAEAAEQGIGVVVRGVVKKYRDDYAGLFAKARLDELCADDESMDAFLIRFASTHPGASTMIIGTKNLDHLTANLAAAARGKLPAAVYAEAKRRLDAIGITPGK